MIETTLLTGHRYVCNWGVPINPPLQRMQPYRFAAEKSARVHFPRYLGTPQAKAAAAATVHPILHEFLMTPDFTP